MKWIVWFLIAGLQFSAMAQESALPPDDPSRPRNSDELNKESSSFIGDPDSLDPLPVKRENLKEDEEEPVLEDIRQVLEAPSKPKRAVKPKKRKQTESSRKSKVSSARRVDDEPDVNIERKFHKIFQQYNSEPTSEAVWLSQAAGRSANVYIVQRGDTLWSISETFFGDPMFWPKIWSLNRDRIENPHFIYPGAQVLFYAGDGAMAPALAVTEKGAAAASQEGGTFDDSQEPSILRRLSANKAPGVIPDSLPLWRNNQYFIDQKPLVIDLKSPPETPENLTNDILLTDKLIVSEIMLTNAELGKGRCGGEHLLHAESKSSEGEYLLFDPLETIKTESGPIYSYRQVGKAKAINGSRIQITSCQSVLAKDMVFVSPSNVDFLRSNKPSRRSIATLIGGPGLGTQKLFGLQQKAYIDMGLQSVDVGQSMAIRSQMTELPSGEIRILEKFGSFAIGLVVDIRDVVETGDELYLK